MKRSLATALAFVLVGLPAFAQSTNPPPEALDATALEAARRLFLAAYAAGERGAWEEAYHGFARALAIRSSPAVRFNLAIAARHTNRLVEALEHFRAFLREGTDATDATRRALAQREIESLSGRVAQLRVVVAGDAARSFELDGRAQPLALLGVDIPVDPGPHTIEVRGAAGDRQRREGALYEGERMRVEVNLSGDAVTATTITPRSQGFGHWVTQPGPDGRWIDWASQAVPEPRRSAWERRPFTVAVQLGLGSPTGLVAASVRYFPRAWFGTELQLGGVGAIQPGFAFLAHARFASPTSRHAFGVFVGPAVALASLSLSCPASPMGCQRAEHTERSLPAFSIVSGVSSEWRIRERFAMRATVGLRALLNPADFRALEDQSLFTGCASERAIGWGMTSCAAYQGNDPLVDPFVAVDFGYNF